MSSPVPAFVRDIEKGSQPDQEAPDPALVPGERPVESLTDAEKQAYIHAQEQAKKQQA